MISTGLVLIIVGTAIVSALLGWLVASIRQQKKITRLETTLAMERQNAEKSVQDLEQTFLKLSQQALKSSNQTFLQLAQESLKQFHIQAKGDLDQKEKSIHSMIQPIRDALEKTEKQIHTIEKDRKEAYGALHKHLETMVHTQAQLQSETQNLVKALRRPEVRGQWGEMTLKRLAELAGMVAHCDFYEQEQIDTEEGRMRPDMVVRMPDRREIIVDAKTPLHAYLDAIDANDDETRQQFLAQHTRHVRERIRELASKSYWSQFKNSPDFVVLFIPGEQFLNAALECDMPSSKKLCWPRRLAWWPCCVPSPMVGARKNWPKMPKKYAILVRPCIVVLLFSPTI
jgi:DNA recombination protein RmuC